MNKKAAMVNRQLGEAFFTARDYEKAMLHYALALQEDSQDSEAKIGVLLCDMADEMEQEAHALFDYYALARKESPEEANEAMTKTLASIDETLSAASRLFTVPIHERIDYENAISYADFQAIVAERGGFKRAFEDIMFSTKVIISSRNEFAKFLEDLLSNGFHEVAFQYLESAGHLFPVNRRLKELFKRIQSQSSGPSGAQ